MIRGMEPFRRHFAHFGDSYVLIGGAAADLAMDAAGVPFRATKDLDIVLCIEALDTSFAEAFWRFVQAGEYKQQQRSTGKKSFYRFQQPGNKTYPFMLELFSRKPEIILLGDDSHLTPIPIAEDISSLSAILLQDDYYHFIHQHRTQIDDITIVKPECLIPLKARAWLDLSRRQQAGEQVDSRDIKKHRNDIFRLFQILSPELRVSLPTPVSEDLKQFLSSMTSESNQSLADLGLKEINLADVLKTLGEIYAIPS